MFCHDFCTKNTCQNTGVRLFVTLGFTQRYKQVTPMGLNPFTKYFITLGFLIFYINGFHPALRTGHPGGLNPVTKYFITLGFLIFYLNGLHPALRTGHPDGVKSFHKIYHHFGIFVFLHKWGSPCATNRHVLRTYFRIIMFPVLNTFISYLFNRPNFVFFVCSLCLLCVPLCNSPSLLCPAYQHKTLLFIIMK